MLASSFLAGMITEIFMDLYSTGGTKTGIDLQFNQ
jgi:hypothetical protein